MVTRQQFVDEARTWMGTRWQHQARLKGIAVDCAGLVLETARALGLADWHYDGYPRFPDGTLQRKCDEVMTPIRWQDRGMADVVLFSWDNSPCHLAILTDTDYIIHAYAINRKVIEHRMNDAWMANVAGVYHIPGVV